MHTQNTVTSKNNKWVAFVSNSVRYIFTHRYDAIKHLQSLGYSILVIAPEDIPVPEFQTNECTYLPIQFNNKSLNPWEAYRLYQLLASIYKKYKPVAVFHFGIKANIFGNFSAKKAGVPCISLIAGVGYSFQKSKWLRLIVTRLYRLAMHIPVEVWFVNQEDAALFFKYNIVTPIRSIVLDSEGINTQHFNRTLVDGNELNNDAFTFCCATRPLQSKGISLIIEAQQILRSKGYKTRFLLATMPDEGHPDEIPASDFDRWQQEGLMTLLSFLPDVRPLLAASQCFVLPSFYNEGLPQCLLEAASMELPIITTNVKGCKEAVQNGSTGWLCVPNDAQALAIAMEVALKMPKVDLEVMGMAGRKYMEERFSIERICSHYSRVLTKLEKNE